MKIFAVILSVLALPISGVSAEGTRAAMTAEVESTTAAFDSPEDFLRRLTTDGGAGSCNLYCESNSDCELSSGDYNPCTKCGSGDGTEYNNRCYNPEDDSAGQCNLKCKKDKDCDSGGWNPCGSCGEYIGAQFYQHCYNADANPQKPANDCDEGQCCKHCNTDSDCQKGGANLCPKCGQYAGTQYYRRCYDPDYVD